MGLGFVHVYLNYIDSLSSFVVIIGPMQLYTHTHTHTISQGKVSQGRHVASGDFFS